MDITAVAADPHDLVVALEDDVLFQVGQQLAIALLVALLHLCNQAHDGCNLREALFLGHFGKLLVHFRPLIVLALCGVFQIGGGIGNGSAMEILEPDLGVFLLVVGGLLENRGDLLKAVLLGLGCIVGVLVSCLRLSGKGCHQVGFGSASFQFHDLYLPLILIFPVSKSISGTWPYYTRCLQKMEEKIRIILVYFFDFPNLTKRQREIL